MNKNSKKVILIFIICFIIVFYGFIYVSANLPKFIKDRAAFKIDYSLKPFNFKFDFGDYSFYVNTKAVENIKYNSSKITGNIKKEVLSGTSNIMNKTENTFKYVGNKISNIIEYKVR